MFASVALAAAMQIMPITIPFGAKPRQIEQARAPIERMGPRWAEECAGSDNWEKPGPPMRIHGNSYYVGTCGIAAILITGADGHILIDGGTDTGSDIVAENIRRLGFRLRDIKYILYSHEHPDHVAGIARLQKLSGATLLASPAAAKVLNTGVAGGDDPQAGMSQPFPAANVGGLVVDGQEIRLGDIMVKAMTTPGHTPGAMSWRWVSCDGGVCRTIVYADSLTPVSREGYRFTEHPSSLAAFRASIAKIAQSDCDILITPHPEASQLDKRFEAGKPLLDPAACKSYAADRSKMLDERVAKEQAASK